MKSSILLLKEIESMLITAANNVDISKVTLPATEKSVYKQAHKLELQLQRLLDLVKAFRKS